MQFIDYECNSPRYHIQFDVIDDAPAVSEAYVHQLSRDDLSAAQRRKYEHIANWKLQDNTVLSAADLEEVQEVVDVLSDYSQAAEEELAAYMDVTAEVNKGEITPNDVMKHFAKRRELIKKAGSLAAGLGLHILLLGGVPDPEALA